MKEEARGAAKTTGRRVVALDIARSVALVGMAIYHFSFDLEMFGYLPPGASGSGGLAIFARIVAGSFLFITGLSLFLAHGRGIRWRPFLRRLFVVALAAGFITAATRYAMPDRYIFFGILHSIAVAGVIGLAFLRLPALLVLGAAAAVVLAKPYLQQTGAFDVPALAWLGLATWHVRSVDFVPVFPWLAASLAGIGVAKLGAAAGLWARISVPRASEGNVQKLAAWPGRHSLVIYLVHQPVLVGCLWLVTKALR